MEKKTASGLMLSLLLTSMLTLVFSIQPVKADWAWTETIYIRADGGIDPETAPLSTVDDATYELTDNIVGDVPYGTSAIVVERDNIVIDGADYTVQSTEGGTGIDLSYRSNVTLKNVEIKNFGNYGIYLYHSSNNTLTSNTVLNNYDGICLSDFSNNNAITGNNVSSNSNIGLYIYYDSNNNVVTGNNVSNNMAGIQLQISSNNALTGNTVLDNYDGIRVESSSNNNVITGNNISSNQDRGINFHYSRDNTFADNTVSKNLYGIYVFYFSSDNTFFHNNLLDNTFQAYAEFWHVNTWDDGYLSGGNYWSDYSIRYPDAQELDDSGIWDTPYVIDENNQDNYPLMEPWTPTPPTVTVLAVSPTSIIAPLLGLSSIFRINITVADVQDLAGYELILSYNTSILTAIDCGFDPFFDFPVFSLINDQEGYVYLVAITWSDVGLTAVAPKPIAWIRFSVDRIGTSTLDLHGPSDGSLLGNSMAQPIPHVDVDGFFDNRISVVTATIDIDPDTLNLRSKGKWITAYIQLPQGYNPEDIDASTILLNETLPPVLDPKYDFVTNSSEYLVDHNNDGILERMVKFDRATVESFICNQGIRFGNVALTVNGTLNDGTPFEGSDTIWVKYHGDANNDGTINIVDVSVVSAHWYPGPPTGPLGYDANADLNEDGTVNMLDLALISANWGQTVP